MKQGGDESQAMAQAMVGSTCASSVERFCPLERARVRAHRQSFAPLLNNNSRLE